MKIISDIRLFKSSIANINGNSPPKYLDNKRFAIIARRIAMKLREAKIELDGFDHVYLNFTPCVPKDSIQLAQREVDGNFSWYRYFDIGVDQEFFDKIENSDSFTHISQLIIRALCEITHSSSDIEGLINEVLDRGEDCRMKFKEKSTKAGTAVIYLRLLNNGYYLPSISVTNTDGITVFNEDLQQIVDFNILGEIQLSGKSVTIKPRKNMFTEGLEPIRFQLPKQ